MKVWVIFLVFMISINLVYALDVQFSCPEEVTEEFICSIQVSNFSGTYDLKLDFTQEGKRVSKIMNEGVWKSTNYYLVGFITDEGEKQVKIQLNASSGVIEGVLKLRKTSKTAVEYQENISISVLEAVWNEENETSETPEPITQAREKQEKTVIRVVQEPDLFSSERASENIINLNPVSEETVIYESRNEKIKQYSVYGFCLFLIFIIIILLLRK